MSWSSSLANNPPQTLFFVLLFLLPVQLGKHFWVPFSFISGIRVDYLSPTLYITDILILLFCALSWRRFGLPLLKHKKRLMGVLLVAFLNLLFSVNPLNTLIGLTRLVEYILFAFFAACILREKSLLEKSTIILLLSSFFVSIISYSQFYLQRSVGGLLYFFGERSFTGQTPGIANASLDGTLVLRPYATFPHPNVLGGFLAIVIVLCLFFVVGNRFWRSTSAIIRSGIGGGIVVSAGALLLSMSRSALLITLFAGVTWLSMTVSEKTKRILIIGSFGAAILSGAFIFGVLARFLSVDLTDESVILRGAQVSQSVQMIASAPLFGVGLQNYLIKLGETQFEYRSLQPVHNVFLLVTAETGISGLTVFLLFLWSLLQKVRSTPPQVRAGAVMLFVTIIFLGMVDHYWYTLHQGRLLAAFVFATLSALSPQRRG